MGQIVKRKKKGRPSKADLARRAELHSPANAESERRRSLRRRNVRYNNFIDFDDYLDDEEFEEEEEEDDDVDEVDQRRKEKKLKLVLKLNSTEKTEAPGDHALGGDDDASSSSSSSSSSEDEESERKQLKKKKINGGGDESEEDDNENDHEQHNNIRNHQKEKERKSNGKGQESLPGTRSHHSNGLPLPEKRILELILDKLQKKDTYGVYAEPVDLEELPDYLDVIDHPMDFATVRKKLANGSYSTLEQFESDVFLICSNAMEYNAPETIYHKQACAIQELAKRKFEKLRIDTERTEKDIKSEQKTKSNCLAKKQIKKPVTRATQECIGSDFSSGATLANVGDIQNGSVHNHTGGFERPNNTDGLLEANSSLIDTILDKAEEQSSGKDLLSKLGRKSSGFDENRRTTYNLPNQPIVGSESIFSTFECEVKQLVAVGLHAEYSYARSLAHFAATLGPVAWKVASQRIQQALPPGCKFGRGWVGEYEPLPTPVLMPQTHVQKDSTLFAKKQFTADTPKDDVPPRTLEQCPARGPSFERNPSFSLPINVTASQGKASSLTSTNIRPNLSCDTTQNQQKLPPRSSNEIQNQAAKQVELNLTPSNYQHDTNMVEEKQIPGNSAMEAIKLRKLPRTMGLPQSVPPKQQEKRVWSGGLPNGNTGNCLNNRLISLSSDTVHTQMSQGETDITHGQAQGLTDPIEAMRISTEKAPKQQKPLNQSSTDTSPVVLPTTSVRNDANNAAVAPARVWMSLGAAGLKPQTENSMTPKNQIYAESLYNPTRQLHAQLPIFQGQFPLPAGMQFLNEKHCFPFQAFMRPPIQAANEGQFQNRPMIMGNDLSGFQMQSPRQGQPKKKQESLPPDLNIGFQCPGSPPKQSSGMMVDSQQPDLALQL